MSLQNTSPTEKKTMTGPGQRLALVLAVVAVLFGARQLISLIPASSSSGDNQAAVVAWMKQEIKEPGAQFVALAGVRHFWGASYRVLRYSAVNDLGQSVPRDLILQVDASGAVLRNWTPDDFAAEARATRPANDVSVAMSALGFRK